MRENFKQIIDPITAENLEGHREQVEEELKKIQLFYADQIYQQSKLSAPNQKFSDSLKMADADIIKDLNNCLRAEHHNQLDDEELAVKLESGYLQELNEIYSQLPNQANQLDRNSYFAERQIELQPLVDYVKNIKLKSQANFSSFWQENDDNRHPDQEHQAGIFSFNSLNSNSNDVNKDLLAGLEKAGFSQFDEFLEIHIPDIFSSGRPLTPEVIRESLSRLAETIIDKYPQTSAVVGVSWLLGHRAVKRLIEFHIIKEGPPNWRQLIDKDGQIDQNKLQNLITNDELPYKNLYGYLSTEDFLSKFLPAGRKGQIMLKVVDKRQSEINRNLEKLMNADSKKFRADWERGLIRTKEDLIASLNRADHFQNFLRQAGVLEDMLKLLGNNLGQSLEEINQHNIDLHKKFDNQVNDFLKQLEQNKYLDKEVNIK